MKSSTTNANSSTSNTVIDCQSDSVLTAFQVLDNSVNGSGQSMVEEQYSPEARVNHSAGEGLSQAFDNSRSALPPSFPLTSAEVKQQITQVLNQKKMNLMNSPTVVEALRNIQNSKHSTTNFSHNSTF